MLTTVAGIYTKCICTCPKENMLGQSPFRNVAGNILVPAKQYKPRTQGRLREYHKEPHFWPVWLKILLMQTVNFLSESKVHLCLVFTSVFQVT